MIKLNVNRKIKNGMWVLDSEDRVGITQNTNFMNGRCDVHLVDEEGATYLVLPEMQMSSLTQARYQHIPKARSGDKQAFAALGYV